MSVGARRDRGRERVQARREGRPSGRLLRPRPGRAEVVRDRTGGPAGATADPRARRSARLRSAGADGLRLRHELGFVILHRCGADFYFLIVSTWRNDNELWSTVWAKNGDEDPAFRSWPTDVGTIPTFCVWELAAVCFERRAWSDTCGHRATTQRGTRTSRRPTRARRDTTGTRLARSRWRRWRTSTSSRWRCRRRRRRSRPTGRPSYHVHGKLFCFHRGQRPDAVDAETGERMTDVLMFRVDGQEVKELCSPTTAGSSSRHRTSTVPGRADADPDAETARAERSFATSSSKRG